LANFIFRYIIAIENYLFHNRYCLRNCRDCVLTKSHDCFPFNHGHGFLHILIVRLTLWEIKAFFIGNFSVIPRAKKSCKCIREGYSKYA